MKRVLSILFLFLVLGSSVKAQLDFGFKEIVFTQKSDDRDMSGQSSSTSPEDAPKLVVLFSNRCMLTWIMEK